MSKSTDTRLSLHSLANLSYAGFPESRIVLSLSVLKSLKSTRFVIDPHPREGT